MKYVYYSCRGSSGGLCYYPFPPSTANWQKLAMRSRQYCRSTWCSLGGNGTFGGSCFLNNIKIDLLCVLFVYCFSMPLFVVVEITIRCKDRHTGTIGRRDGMETLSALLSPLWGDVSLLLAYWAVERIIKLPAMGTLWRSCDVHVIIAGLPHVEW